MRSIVRQMKTFVQKIARKAELNAEEAGLSQDCIIGISQTGSCQISDIARAKNGTQTLRKETRPLYKVLSRKRSGLDRLREIWVRTVARVANRMSFIAVDLSDIFKIHGKDFECMATIRDASDPRKWKGPGFNTIQIEATDHRHINLPLWQEIFSTVCPQYIGWYETIARAVALVFKYVGRNAIWLFDRGFDAGEMFALLNDIGIQRWIIRQLQTRNVILENGTTVLMRDLASSLCKPFKTEVSYVDKKTHEMKEWPVAFNFVPVRLQNVPGRFWMIVITGLREDMVLLANFPIRTQKQAEKIITAYLRRWAVEEGIRCWKQMTQVEDFRVRNWNAIRRITFFSMMAYGIQAYWLITRPAMAKRLIKRVKQFFKDVPFEHYRLWAGVKDALLKGA